LKLAFTIGPLNLTRGAGLTAAAAGLGRALARGHDVELTIFGRGGMAAADPGLWGPSASVRDSGAGFGLSSKLVAGGFHVVHSHGLWLGHQWGAWRAGRGRSTFRIVSTQGHLDSWAWRRSVLKKRLAWMLYQRSALQSAGCLHALHEGEVASFRAVGLKNPVCVVPNGIDPAPRTPGEPPWQGRIGPGGRILLFLGRVAGQKGAADLVTAWVGAIRVPAVARQNWKLIIAGWPEPATLESIRRLVAQHRLQDSVFVLGPQGGAAKDACLACADAFVLPSRSEGLPMAVLEAWSHGLPVAMTDACNLPIGFSRHAAFRIVNEPGRLEAGLSEFLSLPRNRLAEMGQEGKQLSGVEFSWSSVAARMMEVYRWGLGQGAAPSTLRFSDPADPGSGAG
jgi:glycosyltransferase involved in cell wall biosynthesis